MTPAQTPLVQTSPTVHGLPSLHPVPFGAGGFEQDPVPGLQVPATWHWSIDAQITGLPGKQAPATQTSASVQRLPSLHAVPSGFAGFEHAPVKGLHVPATWHGSLAVQVTGLPPKQVPASQKSPCVHALPSLHGVPFGAGGFEQSPVTGLQIPATWHGSLAEQTTAAPGWQVPPLHTSPVVQALPSSQGLVLFV